MNPEIVLLGGNGKMGKEIQKHMKVQERKQPYLIDPAATGKNAFKSKEVFENDIPWSIEYIVAIDFTEPGQVMENIEWCAKNKMNMVVGTTGWNSEIKAVEKIVKNSGIGLIYASNFSTSVQMTFITNRILAAMMNEFGGWDVSICETHHNQKKDVSGTAKTFAGDIVKSNLLGKGKIVYEVAGPINDDEITISSCRLNKVFGEHTIRYAHDDGDRIDLFHHADSRAGFAKGALDAADFIRGKSGLYDYSEVLRSRFITAIKRELGAGCRCEK